MWFAFVSLFGVFSGAHAEFPSISALDGHEFTGYNGRARSLGRYMYGKDDTWDRLLDYARDQGELFSVAIAQTGLLTAVLYKQAHRDGPANLPLHSPSS